MSKPDPFAPIGSDGARPAKRAGAWQLVAPVPADAPLPPLEHFKLGKPTATWTYTDAAGAVLGYVLRFDTAEKKRISSAHPAAARRRRT